MTDPGRVEPPATQLDERGERILGFERAWADRVGNRDAAIRAEFGVSPARYYQMLDALIDSPIAVRHDPLLVRRLQRLRDTRRRARSRPSLFDRTDSQDRTD